MIEFRWGNTVVEIHFLFLSLITLCLLVDQSGIALCGLLASLLHEFGHLSAFVLSGYAPRRLSFEIFGIRLEQRTYEMAPLKETFVLLAGSGMNFLCFGLSVLFCGGISKIGALAGSHFVLGVLNLIPVAGFDGGKLLQLGLEQVLPIPAADRLCESIQMVITIFITTICIYCFLEQQLHITAIFLCIYLWLAAERKRKE
jgi:Zn-dependent protease